jgi:hypothetical protein
LSRTAATPTVLDVTMRQLAAPAAVWSTVAKWDVSMQLDRLLGDCLKVRPSEHVTDVERAAAARRRRSPMMCDPQPAKKNPYGPTLLV